MVILIAPDKFKGTLSASAAARAIATGVRRARPEVEVVEVPLADGGEGTLEALAASSGARQHHTVVHGPLGTPVSATWLSIGDCAFIEAAQAIGLPLIAQPSPLTAWTASSFGVGSLIAAARDAGFVRMTLAVGGVASMDGGAGAVRALAGAAFDATGILPSEDEVATARRRLHGMDITIITDVHAPLLGADGAVERYAAQKGADGPTLERLTNRLWSWSRRLEARSGRTIAAIAGCGAAGGLPAPFVALVDAPVMSGADFVAKALGIEPIVRRAGLVITGEGALDDTSLQGKAPVSLARLAAVHDVPVVALVGRLRLGQEELRHAGIDIAISLESVVGPVAARRGAAGALEEIAAHGVTSWLGADGAARRGAVEHI